jgi:hypothetical protein
MLVSKPNTDRADFCYGNGPDCTLATTDMAEASRRSNMPIRWIPLFFSIHWDAASRACSLFVCSSSGSGPLSISPPLIPHHGNLLAQVSLEFGNQRPPADDGGHRAAVGRGICLGDLQRSFLSFIVSLSLKRQWNAYVDRELLLTP